jgi:hypothetical protein
LLSNIFNNHGDDALVTNFSVKGGIELFEVNNLKFDLFLGPTLSRLYEPVETTGIALDILPRLLYTKHSVQPYIDLNFGGVYWPRGISGQGTNWGFILGGGAGTRFSVSEENNKWLFVEYRFWHESNGRKVFGTRGPNPGFNADTVMFGFEWEF